MIMPRKPVIRSNEHYYHITARSNNKENFYVPIEEVWEIMLVQLQKLQKENQLKISAFVLMNNHFHLMLLSPSLDIDKVMYFFMKAVTRKLQLQSGRINKIFGGRYKGCLIDNQNYLMNVYKYVYRNPVAAGITGKAEDYLFSTYHQSFATGRSPLSVEKIMPLNLQVSKKTESEWINEAFLDSEAKSLKCGLSKTKFKYQKDRALKRFIQPG